MKRVLWPAALLAGLALFGVWQHPGTTAAHPLGNFTVNRLALLDLTGDGQVKLRYVVDAAEIPTFQSLRRIDADRDGMVSDAEEQAYLAAESQGLIANLHLDFGGRRVDFSPVASDLELLPGQGGLQTLRIVIEAAATHPADWTQGVSAAFRDANYEGQPGWRDVVVRPGPGVDLYETSASMVDQTAELTSYPEGLLQSPPNRGSATFAIRPGETLGVPSSPQGESVTRDAANKTLGRFASLVERQDLTPGFVALALLLAAGWGAMHALGPGHGKTLVAAYLVGERGTGRHALLLGLVVTATHTVSVFALGAIAIFASRAISADDIYYYLSLASGALVLLLGGGLLVTRLRALLRRYDHGHRHDQPQDPAHDDSHGHHHHAHDGHGHSHVPSAPGWRGIVALGVSGGLVPCPTALVVMLGAVAIDRAAYGMVLVTAFSLGLAGVLTGIGLLLVYGRRLLNGPAARLGLLDSRLVLRLQAIAPLLSALGILGAGLLLTTQAVL